MTRLLIYIAIFFASIFCFVKANAQNKVPLGSYLDNVTNEIKGSLQVNKDVYYPQLADSTGDSVLAADSTGKLYNKIASSETPTLQTVAQAGDTTTETINVNGLHVSGFERAPGNYDGGAGIYVKREAYTGGAIDTVYGNSIHSYIDGSILSIGNNSSFAAFDALSVLYSDSTTNMSAITGFQNNIIWDYPAGSTLDKMYGFNSVLLPKSGTVTTIYDFYAHHLAPTGAPATIGDHYAFYSEDFAGANTASRNHGIHILGAAMDNYFAGNVGIGDTNRGSYKLEVSGTTNLNGATLINGAATVGGTSAGSLRVNNTDGDYVGINFSGGLPRLELFNSGIALGNLTMNASGLFAFDRGVSVTGNLTVSGTLTMSGSGFLSGGGSAPQLGALSLWAGAGTSPFIELSRAGVARDWHIGSLTANGNLVFNSAPSTSANISGTTVMTLEKASGELGIGNSSPTAKLHVTGSTGYNQVRMETSYTPTSTADANGSTGDIAWDADYIYIKTAAGWKRAALTTW